MIMTLLPISYVSLHTGVNPITLRAWESRYGIIKPLRTGGGHRLYSEEDIKLIKTILFLRSNGHALKEIPGLLKKFEMTQNDLYTYTIPNLIDGLKSFNALKVQKELQRLLSQQPIEMFADKTLLDILSALKKALWAESIYFTQERCFFYEQLRFQLQQRLYQFLEEEKPIQIKIIGFNTPKRYLSFMSRFTYWLYYVASISFQYALLATLILLKKY